MEIEISNFCPVFEVDMAVIIIVMDNWYDVCQKRVASSFIQLGQ